MLVRRPDLAATMSRYLVDRIRGLANLEVVTDVTISGLEGHDGVLQAVRWRVGRSGQETQRPIRHLFLFIGAEPNTDWLNGSGIALDGTSYLFALVGAEARARSRQFHHDVGPRGRAAHLCGACFYAMDTPPRSFAAAAHECIMVRVLDPPDTRSWRD